MRTFTMLSLTFGIALATASCSNEPGGRATPIDSTNDYGKAPVEYNGSAEAPKTDTTMQSHLPEQKARQDNNANATIGSGNNAAPASNTTDSATTSGSATRK